MSSLRSSVLFIGAPANISADVGGDLLEELPEFLNTLVPSGYPVIVIALSSLHPSSAVEWLKKIRSQAKKSLVILIADVKNLALEKELINSGMIFKILPSWQDAGLEHSIREALAHQDLQVQNLQLINAAQSLNENLEALKIELEHRVQKRQHEIEQSKTQLTEATRKLEALHKMLVSINRSQSIHEIESNAIEALKPFLKTKSLKISLHGTNLSSQRKGFIQIPIKVNRSNVGLLTISVDEASQATLDKPFLNEIASAIGLALQRLARFEQAESLKQEWEAAFDSIEEPVSVINSRYEIVRFNKAYANLAKTITKDLVGKHCYKILFNRESPCRDCELNKNFELKHEHSFHVVSRKLSESSDLFVVFYQDVTESKRLQRNIMESAKLAELGLVGGSIAHELNNPIAGMLTFAQLIKMDLKGDETYFDDIVAIEEGIKRSRDIVQNLLGFTRKSTLDAPEKMKIKDVIEAAAQLLNIQTKTLGINVALPSTKKDFSIMGDPNHLTQALVSILQESINAVKKRMETERDFKPKIKVEVQEYRGNIEIIVADTGHIEPGEPRLGLTLAYDIITHHGGSLEFFEDTPQKVKANLRTQAKISFPRPVF